MQEPTPYQAQPPAISTAGGHPGLAGTCLLEQEEPNPGDGEVSCQAGGEVDVEQLHPRLDLVNNVLLGQLEGSVQLLSPLKLGLGLKKMGPSLKSWRKHMLPEHIHVAGVIPIMFQVCSGGCARL